MAKTVKLKNAGVKIKAPELQCNDKKCSFHGSVKVRGALIKGTVVSDRMERTVVVNVEYLHRIQKYKRYERRRSTISAHNPPCVDAKKGDKVTIGETRPLSKNVRFIVLERMSV